MTRLGKLGGLDALSCLLEPGALFRLLSERGGGGSGLGSDRRGRG